MFEFTTRTKKRISIAFKNTVSIVCSVSLLFSNVSGAFAQQIIVDPSAPGTGFLNTDTLTPQINISTPQSGVSLNQFSSFNVDENGVILNNSITSGVSQLGANVTGNPNLIVSGPANVIVNEVTGAGASTLVGTTEVFGQAAAVIIANPNGISCNGCDFLNSISTTLSTGTAIVTGGDVSLSVSQGTITIGPDGFQTENSGGIYGRHVIIDGAVSTVNTGADNGVQIVGGSQFVTVDPDNLVNSSVAAAPILNSKLSPFGVDATSAGVITSGIVDVRSVETGLGINLYGDVDAAHGFYAVSNGDLFFGDVSSSENIQLFAIENIRQYGDITTQGDVVIDGKSYTLYQDRRIDAGGDITVNASDFVVIAGEVSGNDIAIDVANGSLTNTGFILASGDLTIIAGEDALQQRGIATEYDIYFDPALQVYIEAYQAQLLAGGDQADIAAEMLARASQHDVVQEYIDRGASMSGTNVAVTATDDIRNTGGAIAATNDVVLLAGANIINEYLAIRRLLGPDDGCNNSDCGYDIAFHAGEILAGHDLILNAGADIQNLASTLAAANNVTANAGGDIVNALTHSSYIYEKGLTGDFDDNETCDTLLSVFLGRACASFGLRALLELPAQSGGSTDSTTVVVMAPALIASLYGDVTLEAVGSFDSVGSEVSAGNDLSIIAGEEIYLGSIVDIAGIDVPNGNGGSNNPWGLPDGSLLDLIRIFSGYDDDEDVPVTYYLTTATSNLIGRTISLQAGSNIVMTGARVMAEEDLSMLTGTGSILIDSTDLPDDIALTTESARFVELDNDVVGQIFGSAEYYQTPPEYYTDIYSNLLLESTTTDRVQQELLEALAQQILAEVAYVIRTAGQGSDQNNSSGWGPGHFGGNNNNTPPSFAEALQQVLGDSDTLKNLTQSAYYQIAVALSEEFSDETGQIDVSEGGIYKLLNDLVQSDDSTTILDGVSIDLITEVGEIIEAQLIADEAANPTNYYEGYDTGVWRWGGFNATMQALNANLPAIDATPEEIAAYETLQIDDKFMSDLIMAMINVTAVDQGFDAVFEVDSETGELDDRGYDLSIFVENEDIQRIVFETARILRDNQETGAMTFVELRQHVLDDSTNENWNTYGILPDLLNEMKHMLRDEAGDILANHLILQASDRVLEQDTSGVLTDLDSLDTSFALVGSLAEALGDQALEEVENRIASNTADYLQTLARLNALTAVEALRRADSGADIKDAVRAVGVQSFETLFQGMDEAALQQQITDASAVMHDTFTVDLDALNSAAWQEFDNIQQQIAVLEEAILDVNANVDPAMMQALLTELDALQAQNAGMIEDAVLAYDAQVAATTAYWNDEIDDAKFLGAICSSACEAAKAQKQNALNALAADQLTTLSALAASFAIDRIVVLDLYSPVLLSQQLSDLESAFAIQISDLNSQYSADVASTTNYWDDEIEDSMFLGLCGTTCQNRQQQKQNALNALAATFASAQDNLEADNAADQQEVLDQYNAVALGEQVAALQTTYDAVQADYDTSHADIYAALAEQLLALSLAATNLAHFQTLVDELGSEAMAEGTVIEGESSLSASLTSQAFPELDLLEIIQTTPEGIVANMTEMEAQERAYYGDLEQSIEQITEFIPLADGYMDNLSVVQDLNNLSADVSNSFVQAISDLMVEKSAKEAEIDTRMAYWDAVIGADAPASNYCSYNDGDCLDNKELKIAELTPLINEYETLLDTITVLVLQSRDAMINDIDVVSTDVVAISDPILTQFKSELIDEFTGTVNTFSSLEAVHLSEFSSLTVYWDEAILNSHFMNNCGINCSDAILDKAVILSRLEAAYLTEITQFGISKANELGEFADGYSAAGLATKLALLEVEYASKPDFTPRGIISTDKAEQDAFIEATAWRFSLESGMEQLNSTPRTIVYADNDLTLASAEDIYIEGATTIAAGNDLSIAADRRIGLLAAVNSQFRLADDAYDAFTKIGETLQLGTLMRDPYSSETDGSGSNATDVGAVEFAYKTRHYTLSSTVLTSGGDLILAANGDAGEILNFGGSVIAGENLVVSAKTDIRNEVLRNNFTLTRSDGCGGSACGNTGHDYRPAEFLAGSGMLLTAGQDIINNGSIMSAAGTLMATAEGNIVNEAITSQYLYYYVNSCGFLCITRKKKKLYRAAISEGVMSTEYGDLILDSGANILVDGSVLSAGAAVTLTAIGDIELASRSEELQNYYKRRGFSGLSFGSTTTKWNEFATALATVEGTDIYMTAEGNITGMGSVLMANNDIDLVAGENLIFDAHQNTRYNYSHGWSIGLKFGGSGLFEALIGDGDLLEAYMATNPALAAVHLLATSEDKWDTINGRMALGYHIFDVFDSFTVGKIGSTDTRIRDEQGRGIAESLAAQFNPFDWANKNKLLNSDYVPENPDDASFTDFLNGITIRLGFFSSKQEWTESHFSKIIAGHDLWLDAEKDIVLVGGTVASASNDVLIYAEENVLMTALADWSWSESTSWGVSVGFNPSGTSFGFDYSGSNSNSTLYTNAVLTAGNDLDIVSGMDTTLMGANLQGRNVYMDVGGNLTLASQQNASESDSFGFNFTISQSGASGGFSVADANRLYTDNVSSIIASDRLSIYVGDTTYLMGATMASKAGHLELSTGSLVFDNYEDSDISTGFGISGNVGFTDTTSWDFMPSVDYSNTQGITHATIGVGTITLRDWEDYDLSNLNRDIDNVQEIISSKEFHISIPGVNLKRWAGQVERSLNLLQAVTTVPDTIRVQGQQAVMLYQRMIFNGVSPTEARELVQLPDFGVAVAQANNIAALEAAGIEISDAERRILALSELVVYKEVDGELAATLQVECALFGRKCEFVMSKLEEVLSRAQRDDLLGATLAQQVAYIRDSASTASKALLEKNLLGALLICAVYEPEVYQTFVQNMRATGQWDLVVGLVAEYHNDTYATALDELFDEINTQGNYGFWTGLVIDEKDARVELLDDLLNGDEEALKELAYDYAGIELTSHLADLDLLLQDAEGNPELSAAQQEQIASIRETTQALLAAIDEDKWGTLGDIALGVMQELALTVGDLIWASGVSAWETTFGDDPLDLYVANGTLISTGLAILTLAKAKRLYRAGIVRALINRPTVTWGRGIKEQGDSWENLLDNRSVTRNNADLGDNLNITHPNHRTFDYLRIDETTGRLIATSAKTMDTATPSRIANPRYVGYTINRMIRSIEGYSDAQIGNVTIGNLEVVRRIELAVPSSTTPAQRAIIAAKVVLAESKNIELVVTFVP